MESINEPPKEIDPAAVLAALNTFHWRDIHDVAWGAMDELWERLQDECDSEDAFQQSKQITETFRLAWLLKKPGMAAAIAAERPN